MHIHEYQAKEILRKFDIFIPEFFVVSNVEEIKEALSKIKAPIEIKAQVHGRVKEGRIAHTKEEAFFNAKEMIGMKLNHEIPVHQVLLFAAPLVEKKYSLELFYNKKSLAPYVKLSQGEKSSIFPFFSLKEGDIKEILSKLCTAFMEIDAEYLASTLLLTVDGKWMPTDLEILIDDHALYRQKEIRNYYDPTQGSWNQAVAFAKNFFYRPMKGNIGSMVNCKTLGLASADLLHYFGGEPAHFLAIDRDAKRENVRVGLSLLLKDYSLKSILINMVGGDLDCASIAGGILLALAEHYFEIKRKKLPPIVVRLQGGNQDKGNYMLLESKFNIKIADSFEHSAKQAVIAAGIL